MGTFWENHPLCDQGHGAESRALAMQAVVWWCGASHGPAKPGEGHRGRWGQQSVRPCSAALSAGSTGAAAVLDVSIQMGGFSSASSAALWVHSLARLLQPPWVVKPRGLSSGWTFHMTCVIK